MSRLVPRLGAARLRELATHLRIVMVNGPRQSGKTTLLNQYLAAHGGSYRTLDREETRQAALDDPPAFVSYGVPPRMIDEVQLGGDRLIRAIKVAVDTDPRPGHFILSGSSRFLTVPQLSESLAGRLGFVELWPLSMAERTGARGDFVARVFGDPAQLVTGSDWTRGQYLECVAAGGFPEPLTISSTVARRAWYDGYLTTLINRDIREFATVTRADALVKLLTMVAARAGGLLALSDLATVTELSRDTARAYLSYLEMVYLVVRLPSWSTNFGARVVKSPKLYPADAGLAAHLLDVDAERIAEPGHTGLGPLVEIFVVGELIKALSNSDLRVQLFHLRTADKREVDLILEDARGRIVAIEVKASSSPGPDALRGLRWLRERLGDRLHAGILLHLGQEAASRGERLFSLPLSTLWDHQPLPR